ncbi:MAG: IS1634 family transposase, partial [Candidatus Heimdallarchaeota archaeon]
MQLRKLVNDLISPKRNQGIDLGRYIELMVINRLVEPKSKNKIANWYNSTFLKRYYPIPTKQLRSQRFWDHMNYFSIEMIEKLERAIVNLIIPEFQLELDYLLFDPTNFSTYIKPNSSNNDNNELSKFGASKSKRFDLLQINLSLLVTREDGIPLLHHTYPGNVNDPSEFKDILPQILDKYRDLASYGATDLTLIFDKGNNSPKNLNLVNASDYHFVGSLRPSTQSELLFVPVSRYDETITNENDGMLRAYRCKKKVYDQQYTLVMSYCRGSGIAAKINLKSHIKEVEGKLLELQQKIGQPYYRKKSTIENKVKVIMRKVKGMIETELLSSKGK